MANEYCKHGKHRCEYCSQCRIKRNKLGNRRERQFVIMDTSEEHAYLHGFRSSGPIIKRSPSVFSKQEADNILARARNAGWLVGDFEIIRF